MLNIVGLCVSYPGKASIGRFVVPSAAGRDALGGRRCRWRGVYDSRWKRSPVSGPKSTGIVGCAIQAVQGQTWAVKLVKRTWADQAWAKSGHRPRPGIGRLWPNDGPKAWSVNRLGCSMDLAKFGPSRTPKPSKKRQSKASKDRCKEIGRTVAWQLKWTSKGKLKEGGTEIERITRWKL